MNKKYIQPAIKAHALSTSESILAGSNGGSLNSNPTQGIGNAPGNGGQNDGSHPVGAKSEEVNYNGWEE